MAAGKFLVALSSIIMPNQDNKIQVQFNADGSQSIVGPNGEVLDTITPGEPEGQLSPAMADLRELQAGENAPIIRSLTLRGKKYFIRRLCWGGASKFGMLTPRDEDGNLMLDSEDDSTSLMAAVLLVGRATSLNDPTPYYRTWQEAHTWARDTSPEVVEILGQIWNAFLVQNRTLLPDAKRQPVMFDDEELDEKKDPS